MLPLIISGAVSPTSSSFWTAIYLGTLLGALVWVAKGIPAVLKRIGSILAVPFVWMSNRKAKKPIFELDDEA